MRVGVISDTHGLLRPEAVAALSGVDLILHAGDVGSPEILDALRRIAPLEAVRGNVDHGAWALNLPVTTAVTLESVTAYMLHDLATLDLDPVAAGIGVVIYGHSHKPEVITKSNVIFLNPGSAGPRRFSLPVTLARLDVSRDTADARIIELDVEAIRTT